MTQMKQKASFRETSLMHPLARLECMRNLLENDMRARGDEQVRVIDSTVYQVHRETAESEESAHLL